MLSIIIPSYKDKYLVNTISSILDNAETEFEIVAVLDGYWPDFDLPNDLRVRYLHLGKNRGMRGAINAGIAISRGDCIMRSDEHCHFGKGFDRIMLADLQNNWILTARRFYLNPVEWKIMEEHPCVDYEKLVIQDNKKFSGQAWRDRARNRQDILVDETMAMQGSMWMMKRSWWDSVIIELQTEGYGPLYQDSHEMVFKTWQAGGKLMVTKKTWFAHKHRSFPRTHNNGSPENKHTDACWLYSLNKWKNYYINQVAPNWFGDEKH